MADLAIALIADVACLVFLIVLIVRRTRAASRRRKEAVERVFGPPPSVLGSNRQMPDQIKPSQAFRHGPLYELRHEITQEVNEVIQTGDILCRLGDETFMGIPFSRLVARATQSKWSHSSVAKCAEIDPALGCDVVEVNDRGTQSCKFIDWLDFCTSGSFAIYRRTDLDIENDPMQRNLMLAAIQVFLSSDPDYDFLFSSDRKYYCTEATAAIYTNAGMTFPAPELLKDLVTSRAYKIGYPINWLMMKLFNVGLPTDRPIYVVGNSEKGMLADPNLSLVYEYSAT